MGNNMRWLHFFQSIFLLVLCFTATGGFAQNVTVTGPKRNNKPNKEVRNHKPEKNRNNKRRDSQTSRQQRTSSRESVTPSKTDGQRALDYYNAGNKAMADKYARRALRNGSGYSDAVKTINMLANWGYYDNNDHGGNPLK